MRSQLVVIAFLLFALPPFCSYAQDGIAHPVAPDIALRDVDNHFISLENYKGKVVVVNFWKASCLVCQKEVANLASLQEKYHGLGFEVINISIDKNAVVAQGEAGSSKNNIVLAWGDKDTLDKFASPLPPTSFIIGRDGRIYSKHSEYLPLTSLEWEIQQLLAAKGTAELISFKPFGKAERISLPTSNELNSDVPGVNLTKLKPAQIQLLESRLDAERCPCDCGNTMLSCRRNHGSCQMSKDAANKEIQKLLDAK